MLYVTGTYGLKHAKPFTVSQLALEQAPVVTGSVNG